MPIDVSILRQQAPMQMPSLMESRARANQLMASDAQLAANALQLQKAQREQQEQEQVRNLLTGGQFDVNAPESMSRLAAFGGAGREAAKTLGEAFKARKEGRAAELKGQESLLNIIKQQTEAAQGLLPSVKDYPSAKRYLDFVWSSPELAERLRAAGQSPETDDKEVQEAIATGRFNDWLLRESRGAGDFAKRVGDQSAIETALTAANEKFRTQSGADGMAVRVGFDQKGYVTEVVSNLMEQGRPELAKQYLDQQFEMAKLKYAGLPPQTAHLMALQENPELFEMARQLNAASAAKVSVDLRDKTGAKFAETFATEAAKQDIALKGAAESAPKLAQQSKRLISLLGRKDLITGTAADFRLNVAKALNLVGADNAETIRNTEELRAALGAQTLSAIKESGLGTGQGFTQKDLTFLENSVAGRIDFDKGSLERLADLAYRAAEESAKKWNARRKKLPADVTEAIGISEDIVVPPRKSDKGAAAATPKQGVVTIKGQEDFDKLPSGAQFKGPDGVVRVKP